MTQPKYAPIPIEDEVRPSDHLPPSRPWSPHRPAEFRSRVEARGVGTGTPGPDQGYGLLLARRFAGRLTLAEGEHEDDVLAGAGVIALRRAALYGRAPVRADLELALRLFGFLDGAELPAELAAERRRLFKGAAHDYWDQRELAASVPDSMLRLGVAELQAQPGLALAGRAPSSDNR